MTNPDDTMRRIEEALDYYDDQWKDGREKLLATIRAALQPVSVPYQLDAEHERAVEEAIDAIDHAAYDHGCIEALGGHDTRELVRRRFAACDAMRALMRRQPKETT